MYHYKCRRCGKRFTDECEGLKYCSESCHFWYYVNKTDGCWLWTGAPDKEGYGRFQKFRELGRSALAHVRSYEMFVGPVPPGKELDHLCRNRLCVRPDHLEPVTHYENMMRGETPWRVAQQMTHCHRGHPLTPENVSPGPKDHPHRRCILCRRMNEAEYRRRKSLKAMALRPSSGQSEATI